ncbi:mesothelin isoform X1 [Pseudonaja textilis]|uniref:mesothelin isoform X1 n=1 Tax=Pseudonaja textilis TaxID=8673 RepID=UPI000EA93F4E|nr:mesothelin isoform X1 [Pseudonaja textilis]
MAQVCQPSLLFAAFVLYIAFFVARVEGASCPAARINVSEVCEDVESIDVKISANLTHLVCDNLQNLSHVNTTFIVQALEFTLRKKYDLPVSIVRVLLNQVDGEELINALEEFNEKIVNSSLISNQAKSAIMRALWDEKLRNEDCFNETAFVTSWFQKRLRPFISGISPEMLQCLHNETMQCEQYQAIVKGLDAEFMKMNHHIQYEVFHSFQLPYLRGLNASASSLQCYASNTNFWVFLEETFQGFIDFLTLKDLETLIPSSDLQKIVNTVPADDLADLFSREGFIDDDPFLTAVLKIYNKTGLFIDRLNQKNIIDILPNGTKVALLAGLWPSVVSSSQETEVSLWLDSRLAHSFMFLNGDMLNASETLNTSCGIFQKIVNKLNENIVMFKDKEKEMYFSIKAYLTASKSRPRCYNPSNPERSSWLAMYLGNYIRYSSARDMRLFTNKSAAIFQDLAFNQNNLELINRNKIRKDLAEMYATALFTVDSDFNLDRLPDQLTCFAQRSTLISRLSPAEALSFIARVNQHCSSSNPSASDRQLAHRLVAQVKTFDKQTLIALGQQAMGLTMGQISNLTPQDLVDHKVLELLGQVKGWNRGQSQILVNKILLNYKLDTVEKFVLLGTLAEGLPGNSFDTMTVSFVVKLAKNVSFQTAFRKSPDHVKKAFVSKILSSSSSLDDILNNVPDNLIEFVPNSLLVFGGQIPDLHKINEKPWSPQQAAVMFGDIFTRIENYTMLSPFILQGFQCDVASKLIPGQLSSLVQEVRRQKANLSEEQLSCMARLLIKSNLTTNLSRYPADVLLFFLVSKVEHQSCEMFYTLASQGNLSLLANGSSQRTRLLENALHCFGVKNTSLSKEQLQKLGVFVCDMKPPTITDSDLAILENLKECPDLTAAQITALRMLLASGNTLYGSPASWDETTLEDLGPLAFYINHTIWDSINKEERMIFFRKVMDGYSQRAFPKAKTILFLKSVGSKAASAPRTKRATETCRSAPITSSNLEDPLFIIRYDSAQQLDACLSDEVVKANLALLLEQPLPNDYVAIVKKKLDKSYPDGIPEDQLRLLGFLSRQYSTDEIGSWNLTSSDTLAALLNPNDGAWEMPQLRRLVSRYMELGGSLTGPLLDMLGGKYLCFLDEEELQEISPASIRNAAKLDISTCAQEKKDILYQKAHTAFANQEETRAYYPLIQPYLGGAPVEELKKLARSHVGMDIDTFINLNPEEVKKLRVQDVKDLLGVNLPDLKEVENHPSVAMWIKNNFQSELDSLGIGLVGGRASVFSTSMGSTVSSISLSTKSDDAFTAASPVIPIMESTLSSPGNINVTTPSTRSASLDLNPFISRDATESYSTPVFKITLMTNEISPSINNTQTTFSDTMPKDAFPTNISASVRADTMDGRRNALVPTEITIDSNNTTTNRTDFPVSGIPAPFIARGVNATTSNEHIINSSNVTGNSTAAPSVPTKSSVSVPTEIVVPSLNITAAFNETGGTPVPPISATDFSSSTASRTVLPSVPTDSVTVVPTTSLNVTAVSDGALFHSPARYLNATVLSKLVTDSNNSTVSAPVVTTTPLDSTTVVISKTRAISYNVSVTSNYTIEDTLFPYNATSSNAIPSVETTVASDGNTTNNDPAFPSPVIVGYGTDGLNVTVSHSPSVVINFTLGANTSTPRTYFTSVMSSITRTSSERLSTLPKHTLATNPALVSKKPITITDKQPTASSKMTFHSQETSPKTAIPPLSSPNRTTSKAATAIQRSSSSSSSSSRADLPTKPPSYPTPNGYINVKPLSASALSTLLSWTVLAVSLTIGIPIQKFL